MPLLAYLLLHRDEPVSRQKLAFTLWPDEAEESARANLRRHLHHLKRALPLTTPDTPWLLVDPQTARWNPHAEYWLDVAEFERLCATPETHQQAVELYAGDLLADCYEDWLYYPREIYRNLYLAALDGLIEHHRSVRDYPRAIEFAGRLLAYDPLREDSVRQLMILRYESGDRAGALKEYEKFLRLLKRELSVDPMPETVAIYESILQAREVPGQFPTTKETPGAPRTSPLIFPFVGRVSEMAELLAYWQRAARGQGRLALVSGEAGVGKTRLLAEFAHQAERQGGRILTGNTHPQEAAPYQAVVAALRPALPMLAALEISTPSLAAVADLIPELRARRSLPVLPRLDAERDRARLFEGVAACLEGLSKPRPLVLVLEDLHWAGRETFALLEFLAHRASQYPLLILGSYREEEVGQAHPLRELRQRLQPENLLTHLPLRRLPAEEVERLLEQVLGGGLKPLAERLYTVSGGNPFFLLELLRDMLDAGHLQVEGDHRSVIAPDEMRLPDEIGQVIARRLARLSDQSHSLAEICAVIGLAFDIEVVRQVTGWSESRVLESLNELLDHQVVREVGGGRYDFAFTHNLIQSYVYQAMPEATRRRRHHRTAHVLEAIGRDCLNENAGELAWHYERGGEAERAAGYYLLVARRALAVHAADEALSALNRALALSAEPRLRFDLLSLREEIFYLHGDRQAQEKDLAAMHALAESLQDEDLICETVRRQIRLQRILGERQMEGELVSALRTRATAMGQDR